MTPTMSSPLPIQDGMLWSCNYWPNKKLSKIISTAPTIAIRKGLYNQSRLVFQMLQMEYVSKQQQSGIRYVLILVTLHPKAAKLLDIVFE